MAAPEVHDALAGLSVRQLKALAQELGLSAAGCMEKADLVALLRAASVARSKAPPTETSKPPRRSLRRAAQPPAVVPAALSPEVPQQREILRIRNAKEDLEVLGLTRLEVQNLGKEEREKLVIRRFREISRLVHPDKCPEELRESATKAFQRLEVARQSVVATKPPVDNSQASFASRSSTTRPPWRAQ